MAQSDSGFAASQIACEPVWFLESAWLRLVLICVCNSLTCRVLCIRFLAFIQAQYLTSLLQLRCVHQL